MARRILFASVPLLFSALILVGMEGALRLLGIGAPPELHVSRLGYQHVELPILLPDQRPDGTPILRTRDRRIPYQTILRDKPGDGLRIFAFGGSATLGLGFSPNVSFPRYLEQMIRAQGFDRPLEVVNLGIVALSSSQVREIVRDVAAHYEPDLLIVYSGNNEFLEIHAQKYADHHASLAEKARESLSRTNFFRLISSAVHRPKSAPEFDNRDLAESNVRMTQDEIIQDIELQPEEVDSIVDRYEDNLDHIARTALASDVPLLLVSVASNWEWRGREDLPPNHLEELVGEDSLPRSELQRRSLAVLDQRIQDDAAPDRYDMLFRRATLLEELGRFDAARADYRESMNTDPHLRRALDRLGERVDVVAARRDVHFVDGVDVLSRSSEHGIVGFDAFYDYVHFTPKGALVLAAALHEQLVGLEILPPTGPGDGPDDYVTRELARIESLTRDSFDVETWLGIGFDPANISNRNLWKYDEMAEGLEETLGAEPDNPAALIYRGNVHFHQVDGAAAAATDYRAALQIDPDNALARANMQRLLRDRSATVEAEIGPDRN